jgi:hypothetical protein
VYRNLGDNLQSNTWGHFCDILKGPFDRIDLSFASECKMSSLLGGGEFEFG